MGVYQSPLSIDFEKLYTKLHEINLLKYEMNTYKTDNNLIVNKRKNCKVKYFHSTDCLKQISVYSNQL